MRAFAVLAFVLGILAAVPDARACSCMKLTPSEGFTSSAAVFTGKVTAITKNESTSFRGLEATLEVKKLWKGEPQRIIRVHTAGSGAACGYPFEKGKTYLVYAVSDEADPMRVSLCSRTAPVDHAKEDLDFLKKPTHRFDGKRSGCAVGSFETEPGGPWVLWVASLALGAVARRAAAGVV